MVIGSASPSKSSYYPYYFAGLGLNFLFLVFYSSQTPKKEKKKENTFKGPLSAPICSTSTSETSYNSGPLKSQQAYYGVWHTFIELLKSSTIGWCNSVCRNSWSHVLTRFYHCHPWKEGCQLSGLDLSSQRFCQIQSWHELHSVCCVRSNLHNYLNFDIHIII